MTYDDMTKAVSDLKDKFGSPLAKELIRLNGVERMAEIPHGFYERTLDIANTALNSFSQKQAAKVIVDAFVARGKDPSADLFDLAHMTHAAEQVRRKEAHAAAQPAPPITHLPSPNEVIAALLQIAAAAGEAVAVANNGASPHDVIISTRAYRKLADELASLEVLPRDADADMSGPARAAAFLKTFTNGLDLGKDIKQVMLSHVQDSVAAMAEYIKKHGVPQSTSGIGSPLASFPVMQPGVERPKLPTHREYRAEQFDKIVHAYHQVFGTVDDALRLDAVTADVVSFVFNSEKMNIPHGHAVTIGADVAIYEVGYVDNLLNAVADLATDGKRFRTFKWMVECEDKIASSVVAGERDLPQWENYRKACDMQPDTMATFVPALDAVRRAGLVPDSNDRLDSAMEAEGVRVKALDLARAIEWNAAYFTEGRTSKWMCRHCEHAIPADDTLDETHEPDCAVIIARQLLEDQS